MEIGIVGLGLIGGSLGRTIIKKTSHTVYGLDTDEKTMLKGRLLNAYNEVLTDDNVGGMDVLIIALYPQGIIEALEKYAPLMKSGSIIIDCGGNKREIVSVMERLAERYPDKYFVGGHPMAGKEFSGINHSSVSIFDKATLIVVSVNATIEVLSEIKAFALALDFEGMVVATAIEHDEIISYTSQLAHIVSASYIKNDIATTHYGFSAGSFRDMTRVARLNPEMWTELMLGNRDYLGGQLEVLIRNLTDFKEAIADNDKEKLNELLDKGRIIKEEVEQNKAQKIAERIVK